MQKLLVVGQISKEFGGNYTTGVSNVIINLVKPLSKDFNLVVFATNYNDRKRITLTYLRLSNYMVTI